MANHIRLSSVSIPVIGRMDPNRPVGWPTFQCLNGHNIKSTMPFINFDNSSFLMLLADAANGVRMYAMLFGLAAFSAGVLLMIRHKRAIDAVFRSTRDARIQLYEQRKFRRRTTASTLIAAIGVMLTSLYWARDPVPFTVLVSMILILLVALMVLAFLDLMSVSLKSIADTDDAARKKMVDEYVRQRKKLADESDVDT